MAKIKFLRQVPLKEKRWGETGHQEKVHQPKVSNLWRQWLLRRTVMWSLEQRHWVERLRWFENTSSPQLETGEVLSDVHELVENIFSGNSVWLNVHDDVLWQLEGHHCLEKGWQWVICCSILNTVEAANFLWKVRRRLKRLPQDQGVRAKLYWKLVCGVLLH